MYLNLDLMFYKNYVIINFIFVYQKNHFLIKFFKYEKQSLQIVIKHELNCY